YFGYHGCNTLEDLRKVLRRSGGVPLDITVHNASIEMTRLLLAERHRWRRLLFDKSDWHSQSEDPSEVLFETPNSTMDLEELYLNSECHENILSWVMVAKPRILRLYNFSPTPLVNLTWWDSLHTLEVNGESEEPGFNLSVFGILSALRLQLSQLELRSIPFTESDLGGGLEFPQLQSLELEQVGSWWKFFAPRLTSLHLYPFNPAPAGVVLTYPNVTEFQYSAYHAALLSGTVLLPKLVSMRLNDPVEGTPGINFVWCKADGTLSQTVAKEITISASYGNSARISYKELMASLRPHTNLMKLHIEELVLPVTFYKAFIKGNSQKDVLCPNLCELVVDLSAGSRSIKIKFAQYNEVFETLGAERRQSGAPLHRLLALSLPSSQQPPNGPGVNAHVFYSNHPLSIAETTSMRAQIEYCKTTRQAIAQNIKEVKKRLQDLEGWKVNNEKMIAVLNWSLSPMRRLPDETLIEILEL
ncbi:5149_t:CDS:2, partial [Acaulospora colombiana]